MTIFKYLNIEKLKGKKGVSTLPTMLLLGGIIIEIAIAIAFLTYYFNVTNSASRLSAEALATARAGLDDGIIKVVRNKDYSNPSGYSVTVGNRVATVAVCKDTCVSGKTQVISMASVLNKQRKLEAILTVDATTGQVTVDSIQETPI